MARKRVNVFNLSFLDVMSCGFGAVVLFYMIITAQVASRADQANADVLSESRMLEEEVLEGRKNLVRLRNTVSDKKEQDVIAEGEIRRMQELLVKLKIELAQYDGESLAQRESIEKLRADIESLEAAKKRLAAEAERENEDSGSRVRTYVGQGNRQYLTGLRMGGKRVLILVDGSTSMLGRTYVNVVRYRNMQDDKKIRAPKWRSAIRTVDWITTQMSPTSDFQIVVFNDEAKSIFPDGGLTWHKVGDGSKLDEGVELLKEYVPERGSSLHNAFAAAAALQPPPDNIYLLTDGLPTVGAKAPSKPVMVRPEQRVKLFGDAFKKLPKKVPVNVLLYPMDGDPDAAGYMWRLALETRGSMMSPSLDWP